MPSLAERFTAASTGRRAEFRATIRRYRNCAAVKYALATFYPASLTQHLKLSKQAIAQVIKDLQRSTAIRPDAQRKFLALLQDALRHQEQAVGPEHLRYAKGNPYHDDAGRFTSRNQHVIRLSGSEFGQGTNEEIREVAYDWAMKNIRGEYTNQETDRKIKVAKIGLDEVRAHSADIRRMIALKQLPAMLEHAAYDGSEEPHKPHKRFHRFHRFSIAARFDNDLSKVTIVVGEDPLGNWFYHHTVTERKKEDPPQRRADTVSGSGLASVGESSDPSIGSPKPEVKKKTRHARRSSVLAVRAALQIRRYTWRESDHPRGQPENAGQFVIAGLSVEGLAQQVKSGQLSKSKAKKILEQHGHGAHGSALSHRIRELLGIERPTPSSQEPKQAEPDDIHETQEPITINTESAYNALLSTSAEDGGLDSKDVPREWREEASTWQTEFGNNYESCDTCKLVAEQAQKDIDSGYADDAESALKWAAGRAHIHSWNKEAQRRNDEALDWAIALQQHVRDAAQSVGESLGINFRESAGGSLYAHYKGLKFRVSDHWQVPGGGFNQGTGERMGEADIEWVIESPEDDLPNALGVRFVVASVLRRERAENVAYMRKSRKCLVLYCARGRQPSIRSAPTFFQQSDSRSPVCRADNDSQLSCGSQPPSLVPMAQYPSGRQQQRLSAATAAARAFDDRVCRLSGNPRRAVADPPPHSRYPVYQTQSA